MSDQPEAKRGRPSLYTPEIAAEICARLAEGETLRGVCRGDDMPAPSTVIGWTQSDKAFSEQYAKAREIGYQLMADEILEIADETRFDTIRGETDQQDRPNTEWISRSRLRVDSRKWLLSKALPKIYGDKIETTTKLVDENDVPLDQISLAQRVAFLLNRGVQAMEEKPA